MLLQDKVARALVKILSYKTGRKSIKKKALFNKNNIWNNKTWELLGPIICDA